MTVIVNNYPIRIFQGAKVGDLVLRYAVRNKLGIKTINNLIAMDCWGHTLDNEAPLTDKQIVKIINS